MRNMLQQLRILRQAESGATAIEYALLIAGIALVIIIALGLVGDLLTALFENIADELTPEGG